MPQGTLNPSVRAHTSARLCVPASSHQYSENGFCGLHFAMQLSWSAPSCSTADGETPCLPSNSCHFQSLENLGAGVTYHCGEAATSIVSSGNKKEMEGGARPRDFTRGVGNPPSNTRPLKRSIPPPQADKARTASSRQV